MTFIAFGLGILFGCAIMLCGGTDNFISSFSIYEEQEPLQAILGFVEQLKEKEKLICWINGTESFVVPVEDIDNLVIEMMREKNDR